MKSNKISLLRTKAINDKNLLKKFAWQNNDARLAVYNKIIHLLGSVQIIYSLIEETVDENEWWMQNNPEIQQTEIDDCRKEIEMFVRIGLFLGLMNNCVESSFRIFARSLDSKACKSGQDNFKNIYEFLLKKLGLNTDEYIHLLDLLRHIRNTIHNNGIFSPEDNKDKKVLYKHKKYLFKTGKSISFFNMFLGFELIDDLISLVKAIVTSKNLVKIDFIKEIS